MSKAETDISNRIRIEVSKLGGRVFRNQVGKALTLDGKRVVTTGLFTGSSDLIGWFPVVVTPDMVGKTVAVFLSIEVKAGDAVPTVEQDAWLDAVSADGGLALVGRSPAVVEGLQKMLAKAGMPIACRTGLRTSHRR